MKCIKVVAAIIYYQDSILITQRNAKGSFPLLWEFAGGKVEANETNKAALSRELKEELNIEIDDFSLYMELTHRYEKESLEVAMSIYECKIESIEDIKLNVHQQYQLVKVNDLINYEFLPADIVIINKLLLIS